LDASATPEQAKQAMSTYQAPAAARTLPSAPQPVILLRDEIDRPQPRLDRLTGSGMTTVVGRVRPDPLFHLKFVVLSHNTFVALTVHNAELS
jgi:aspartate-semialdehyde dehydrogenase